VPQTVAIICSLGLLAYAVFQAVLLSGVPLARFAWGGEDHYLQPPHRPFAILAIVGCAIAIFVALQGAGLLLVIPTLAARVCCYVFVGVFFAAFVLQARSRSRLERRLMLPVFVTLSALFLILALAGNPGA
jgi:hypothetical protein